MRLSNKINIRSVVTLTVFMSFMAILVTSILMFSQKHEITTTIVHTIIGFALLFIALWHFKHNFPSLKNHLKWRLKLRSGTNINWSLILACIVFSVFTLSAYYKIPPLLAIYEWGNTMRANDSSSEENSIKYQKVEKLLGNEQGFEFTVDMRKGPYFLWPQYAIWVESMEGEFIQPIYVTSALAQNNFANKVTKVDKDVVLDSHLMFTKKVDPSKVFQGVKEVETKGDRFRHESLPVFLHKLAQQNGNSVDKVKQGNLSIDAYSGATITDNFLLATRLQSAQPSKVKIRIEINNSFDFNEYYSSNRFPDDPVYSGNGYSAQPSLVYEAIVDINSGQKYFPMTLAGHGHHSGKDGKLYHDMENFTTALQLIDRVIVELN